MRASVGLLIVALLSGTVGCISDHTFGCATAETPVGAGNAEGEVYIRHGCPDQIIQIGNPVNKDTTHWNKYLVIYRIGEGHKIVESGWQEDRFANLAYLIENGEVVDGGYVPEGTGNAILMSLQGAMHPKNRVGYGGDAGWPGSYGQVGRGY